MEKHHASMLTGTQKRDFKLEACASFALSDWKTQSPKAQELRSVLGAFRTNVGRVRLAMQFPTTVGTMAMRLQKWIDIAHLEITGSLSPPSEEDKRKIEEKVYAISHEHTAQDAKLLGTPEWDADVRASSKYGLVPVQLAASAAVSGGAVDAMLAAYITGMWTAFEVLSGDLWEAALNIHPETLSNLNGKIGRLSADDKAELSSFSVR
ncbi:MAG: hypothetical protein QOF94_2845, partial [Acidobacteriaceae bacterium]